MKNTLRSICLFSGNFLVAFVLFSVSLKAQYTQPVMATLAGTGSGWFSGDGGMATAAQLNNPQGIAVNNSGDVYIADELNNRIRRVHSGIISTIAGTGVAGYTGDGFAATAAYLNAPFGIAVDATGNLYIADNQNFRVRMVNTSGIISTIAGTGVAGYTGDGFAATAAKIGYVQGMGIDLSGNLYISDDGNHVVRKIATTGIITTIAGTGVSGLSGDGGAATAAKINNPRGIKADAAGNIYFADNGNSRIRKVDPSGNITTFAGCSGACSGLGPATARTIGNTEDVAIDAAGNIYLTTGDSIFIVDLTGIITYFAGGGIHDTIPFNDCRVSEYGLVSSPYGASFMSMNSHNELYCSITGLHMVTKITNNRPPTFAYGHNLNTTICSGITFVHLDSILAIIDSDQSQWETWNVLTPPVHGTTSSFGYTIASSGDTTNPVGSFYFPAAGYIGTDSFTVVTTDCVGASDTTTVYINIPNCALAVSKQSTGYGPGVKVYPNPSEGTFSCIIYSSVTEDATIVISNVLGQHVQTLKLSTNKQETIKTDLAPGVYILSARTTDGTFNTSIVIR